MAKAKNTPVRATMCPTCPFRPGSKYAFLMCDLTLLAMKEGRICHSTGNNAINHRTGIPPYLCRGARDTQLIQMHSLGVIDAPTDEAWNETRVKYGWEPIEIKDPPKSKKEKIT